MDYTESELKNLDVVRNQSTEIEKTGGCTCQCGRRRQIKWFFKCLYCHIYFCYHCAELHFGKTVKEWKEEKWVSMQGDKK